MGAPLPLGAGAADQIGLLVGELLVILAGMPACDGALLEKRVVPAVVDPHLLLSQVELDDAGHDPGEELTVVGDQHDPSA